MKKDLDARGRVCIFSHVAGNSACKATLNLMNNIYQTLNASPTITKEMQSIPQKDLNGIWSKYSAEYIKLDQWLRASFPKRESGKVSKSLYQSKHARHLELDRVLSHARICSSVFFSF